MDEDTISLIGFQTNKVVEMNFLAEHLELDEKYRLNHDDMCYLGIIQPDKNFRGSSSFPFEDEIPF